MFQEFQTVRYELDSGEEILARVVVPHDDYNDLHLKGLGEYKGQFFQVPHDQIPRRVTALDENLSNFVAGINKEESKFNSLLKGINESLNESSDATNIFRITQYLMFGFNMDTSKATEIAVEVTDKGFSSSNQGYDMAKKIAMEQGYKPDYNFFNSELDESKKKKNENLLAGYFSSPRELAEKLEKIGKDKMLGSDHEAWIFMLLDDPNLRNLLEINSSDLVSTRGNNDLWAPIFLENRFSEYFE